MIEDSAGIHRMVEVPDILLYDHHAKPQLVSSTEEEGVEIGWFVLAAQVSENSASWRVDTPEIEALREVMKP